jgi:hypothetical protein
MVDKVRHQLFLPKPLSDRLEALAAKPGASKSAILVDAMTAWLNRRGASELDDRFGLRLDRMTSALGRIERDGHIILPDGSSMRIDNVPATDAAGYAGLEDKVDFHTWQLIKGVALSTLLGVSSELAFTGDSDLIEALRRSTQDNVGRAGDQITMRNLNIQPTITIRPGAPVRLVVHKDLVLRPWQPAGRSQ